MKAARRDYGYYIMEPQFEQDDADLVWLDLFTDEAALEAGTASWSGSELETAPECHGQLRELQLRRNRDSPVIRRRDKCP